MITFFAAEDIPVFLLDVYGKDTQANLSKAECNELRKILTENVGRKVKTLRRQK